MNPKTETTAWPLLTSLALLLAIATPSSSQSTVAYPTRITGQSLPAGIGCLQGGVCSTFGAVFATPSVACFDQFAARQCLVTADLLRLLRITQTELDAFDVMAIDANGSSGGGFETSQWTFTDGAGNSYVHSQIFAPTPSPTVPFIHEAEVLGASALFDRTFGLQVGTPAQDFGILLFDLDALPTPMLWRRPGFSIQITGIGDPSRCGSECPDLVALALLPSASTPVTTVGMGCPAAAGQIPLLSVAFGTTPGAGSPYQLQVSNVALGGVGQAFMLVGIPPPAPIPLGPIAPSCTLQFTPVVQVPFQTVLGGGQWTSTFPATQCGDLLFQAVLIDPPVQPFGIVLTNGLRVRT